jgi:hypothetical protein
VDDEDYEYLSQYKWSVTSRGYACRNSMGKLVLMHRVIMGDSNMDIDHVDGDRLNNQKSNLRFATRSQNMANSRPHKSSSSKYKGVTWDRYGGKWKAAIMHHGKNYHIGRYSDELEAARAYNEKARELFGEYAYLNPVD